VTVLRVGPGYHAQTGNFVPTSTKPGDKVSIIKMAGFPLTQNQSDDILEPNEELVLFQEADIMFKLVDKLD
jgi:co-chaperonin GroES (HSP10)